MMSDRLKALEGRGQAVWLDFVERRFLAEGGLKKLVEQDGITGVTSNPSIFEKAMGHGDAYDADFAELSKDRNLSIVDIYEHLAIADIQAACDILRPVYDRLDGADGYVSIEVSPYLAQSTDETIVEARRLWKAVDRPNLMVKVPGTEAGVPAIRTLISEGININITLLFAISAYEAVATAYVEGLEARAAKSKDISHIASVASFFVSRIDGQIDKAIDDRVKAGDPETEALKAIRGKVAIANARIVYQSYLKTIAGKNWQALEAKGTRPQRLLWASTGTKDPAYSDVLYVETLIGKDTVNTMPPKTMDAFRDHGQVAEALTQDVEGALHVLAEAERLGLDLGKVTRALVEDGVKQFSDAADTLLGALKDKRAVLMGETAV
jgi:transaldolase/glucose-6-phosphate isomerase